MSTVAINVNNQKETSIEKYSLHLTKHGPLYRFEQLAISSSNLLQHQQESRKVHGHAKILSSHPNDGKKNYFKG